MGKVEASLNAAKSINPCLDLGHFVNVFTAEDNLMQAKEQKRYSTKFCEDGGNYRAILCTIMVAYVGMNPVLHRHKWVQRRSRHSYKVCSSNKDNCSTSMSESVQQR
jgi:hypothetical protein